MLQETTTTAFSSAGAAGVLSRPKADKAAAESGRTPIVEDEKTVEAEITFLLGNDQKPVIHITPEGTREPERTATYGPRRVTVRDARPLAAELSLDREGFALVGHETAVTDFEDEAEVERVYYPEMERLVKEATGASRVLVFDHTLRVDGGRHEEQAAFRAPVRRAHNDYTARSGPQRVRDLLPEEAEALLEGRVAVVNVWRPIRGPVETAPLALSDAASVPAEDLVAADLVYPDRRGEIYELAYNPAHRWYYVPEMTRDEALLIKGYDSLEDGTARFAPHTAFDDPTSPPDAAPRESIEIRTLVFFDPED